MTKLPRISLNKGADERQKRKHPWIFSNEIADAKVFRQFPAGTEVEVLNHRGEFLGVGFLHPNSLIAIRIFSRVPGTSFDQEFLGKALMQALGLREALYPKSSAEAGTYRAVFGEGDGLPGLILDRFQGAWVMEPHSFAMAQRKEMLADALAPWLGGDALVYRTDSRAAALEGIVSETLLLRGKAPKEVWAAEGGIRFPVDPMGGQKTGFFFDQRENRKRWAGLLKAGAAGSEPRCLDIFCHLGAWGFHALAAGAKHVVFVDRSEQALAVVKSVAAANGWSGRVTLLQKDGKEFLASQQDSFSAISLDPPALIPSRKSISQGAKEYRALNELALKALKPGGLLATSSCSYHLSEERFEEEIAFALAKENRRGQILFRGGLSPDHPMIPGMEEGRYLKSFLIEA